MYRIYANVDSPMAVTLKSLAEDPNHPSFYCEGEPTSATHLKLLERMEAQGIDPSGYRLKSYRQEGKPSLQIVIAIPPNTNPLGRYCADVDIDLGNPLEDVTGFFIHVGELLDPGKTDHLDLPKRLKNTPAGDFMYYKVV